MSAPTKEEIRQFLLDRGADLVGFVTTARLDQVTPTPYKPGKLWPAAKTAISIGSHLLDGATAVGVTDSVQNARWIAWRVCDFLNNLALELGRWMERRGVVTLPLSAGNMAEPDLANGGIFAEISHRHVAAQAGLGIIGVPTLCITPQFGPRQYFITVLTVGEYPPDPRLDWDPCGKDCDLCIKACPYTAIKRGARTIKKPLCIPNAMPHGGKIMRDFVVSLMEAKSHQERLDLLKSPQFTKLHRATVFVVGTFAGCFYCLDACPVGRPDNPRPAPRGYLL